MHTHFFVIPNCLDQWSVWLVFLAEVVEHCAILAVTGLPGDFGGNVFILVWGIGREDGKVEHGEGHGKERLSGDRCGWELMGWFWTLVLNAGI